jgi:DNA-3-methyladenine glycosylase
MAKRTSDNSPAWLEAGFFARHHVHVARDLIGCMLVWDDVGGVIVETEAYAAVDDPACHTSFRPSARRFFEANLPGTAYVYMNYGVHWLLNVLALDGIVLNRAMQPAMGIDVMQRRRALQEPASLCSGPGKIGQSLALSAADHGSSLLGPLRHVRSRPTDFNESAVQADTRVGLSQALDRDWRFLLANHPCVSIPFGKAQRTHRVTKRQNRKG